MSEAVKVGKTDKNPGFKLVIGRYVHLKKSICLIKILLGVKMSVKQSFFAVGTSFEQLVSEVK